ncbi:hypothetical protein IT570_13260 [Candidatus Sumerlaeota bacterium]|nr:hypothetical protein [Candidatus Sumerlaeota bacterium]
MASPSRDSTVTTQDIVAHLWRRRLILLAAPCVAVVLGYLLVRLYGNTYRSGAILMIRVPAGVFREGPRAQDFTPPAYADFLKSDDILFHVIDKVRKEDKSFTGKFEDLKKNFNVKTVMTRETVTTAEFSPTLELTVEAGSPQTVHALASEWVKESIQRYGSLRTREVKQIAGVFTEKFDTLMTQSKDLQEQEARLERTVQNLDTLLGAKSRILGGTLTDKVVIDQDRRPEESSSRNNYQDLGIIHERALLELDLAGASPERAAAVHARMDAIDKVLPVVIKEIDELGIQRSNAQRELESVRDKLLAIRGTMDQARMILVGSTADATTIPMVGKADESGDLAVLAEPVLPEKRVGPPRALISIGCGIAIGALLLLLFIMEVYIKRAVADETTS